MSPPYVLQALRIQFMRLTTGFIICFGAALWASKMLALYPVIAEAQLFGFCWVQSLYPPFLSHASAS